MATKPRAESGGDGGGWPLTVFSHGLFGCASAYSGLCAEIASHGSVVIAVEHKDGSAVYSETDDGDVVTYAFGRDTGEQNEHRIRELCAVLAQVQTTLDHAGLGGAGLVDTSSVALVGHSFGGATVLRTAVALCGDGSTPPDVQAPPRQQHMGVRAVVALDPWLGDPQYNVSMHGIARVPTLACLTQSMGFPANERAVSEAMCVLANEDSGGADDEAPCPVLYVEADNTRHQEVSDYPSLSYWPLRLLCMCGKQPAHRSHAQQSSVAVGFLAATGALPASDAAQLTRDTLLVSRLLSQGATSSSAADEPSDDQYRVYGAAVPSTWPWAPRMRALLNGNRKRAPLATPASAAVGGRARAI